MDYKEQIDELRALSRHVPEQMCGEDEKDPLERAADTIEDLLEERDAAMMDLFGHCYCCKHKLVCFLDENYRKGCSISNRGNWEWCGLKKEGDSDG